MRALNQSDESQGLGSANHVVTLVQCGRVFRLVSTRKERNPDQKHGSRLGYSLISLVNFCVYHPYRK